MTDIAPLFTLLRATAIRSNASVEEVYKKCLSLQKQLGDHIQTIHDAASKSEHKRDKQSVESLQNVAAALQGCLDSIVGSVEPNAESSV